MSDICVPKSVILWDSASIASLSLPLPASAIEKCLIEKVVFLDAVSPRIPSEAKQSATDAQRSSPIATTVVNYHPRKIRMQQIREYLVTAGLAACIAKVYLYSKDPAAVFLQKGHPWIILTTCQDDLDKHLGPFSYC